jgi:hypothetical protein
MAFFLVTKFTVSCKDHFLLPYYSKGMWGSKVQPKHKFFFWLFLRDMINTRNFLNGNNTFMPSYTCVLCVESIEEDIRHLSFLLPVQWSLLDIFRHSVGFIYDFWAHGSLGKVAL